MIVLGIDTALAACSAALVREGKVLARRFEPMTRGHAERLFPMLAEICAEAGVRLADVDRIAVTVGPGSFTGTRAGLAAARGIALAARRPAVGVTTLEVVAAGVENVPSGGLIGALFDARRGLFYGQLFSEEGAALTEPFVATGEELPERFGDYEDKPLVLIGTGAEQGQEALRSRPGRIDLARGNALPDAAAVARLGAEPDAGAAPAVPFYLRPPDAVPAAPASVLQ